MPSSPHYASPKKTRKRQPPDADQAADHLLFTAMTATTPPREKRILLKIRFIDVKEENPDSDS